MPRPMKHSGIDWLGDIPADWKIIQLKRFAHVNNGREVQTEIDKSEDAIPVYGSGGVFKYTTDYLYDGEAVMFGRKGTLGKPLYVNEKFWTVDTMYYLTFSDKLFAKFNYYQLCAFDWEPHITQTALPSIVASEIVSCKFAFPPPDEQQRIASFLDDKCARIDSVIEKTRVSVEEYKKLKQALITRAVTKGMRPARPMKDSGVEWLGDIPADWEIIKMKYLFSIIGGNGFPDILQGNATGDYPFCKVSDINGEADYVDTASNWVSQSVVDDNRFNVIPTDSIIIAKIGAALAKNHRKINTVRCCIDNNTQALVPKRKDDIRYLLYLSKCIDMSWFDNNSTVPSINNSKLLNFFVTVPPLDEQEEIAAYLDEKTAAIDSLVAKKNRLAEELTSLKKSLIFEYVTGKKEVPT